MKKTLTALAAIAALGTGIITAQAETGYNANESAGFPIHSETNVATPSVGIFETNQGHNY